MLWGYYVVGASGALVNINATSNFSKYQDISAQILLAELAIFRAFNKMMNETYFQINTDMVKKPKTVSYL